MSRIWRFCVRHAAGACYWDAICLGSTPSAVFFYTEQRDAGMCDGGWLGMGLRMREMCSPVCTSLVVTHRAAIFRRMEGWSSAMSAKFLALLGSGRYAVLQDVGAALNHGLHACVGMPVEPW